MYSSVGQTRATNTTTMSLVKKEYRKGYKIEALPYQDYGVLSKLLWPSKNQVIRIVPGYDPETGEVFKQNTMCGVDQYSPEDSYDMHLSETFCKATTVSRFGSITTPFLSDYAPGSPDEREFGGETVLRNFIRSIVYACSDKGSRRRQLTPISEWRTWCGMGTGTLSLDKQTLLMQALIFHINGRNNSAGDGKDLLDEDGDIKPLFAVVGIDNRVSIQNLCQALVEPSNPALPLDAATNNKYGAMAEVEGNKLFLNTYTDPESGHAALRPSVQAPGKGWTPTPFPLTEEVVRQLWIPWDSLLQYMTAEEQLQLCAREFGADTVNYVIGTNPKFNRLRIPEDIKSAGLGRYARVSEGGSVTFQTRPAAVPLTKGLGMKPPRASFIDTQENAEALRAEVARIRAATKPVDQSAAAKALLEDDDDSVPFEVK